MAVKQRDSPRNHEDMEERWILATSFWRGWWQKGEPKACMFMCAKKKWKCSLLREKKWNQVWGGNQLCEDFFSFWSKMYTKPRICDGVFLISAKSRREYIGQNMRSEMLSAPVYATQGEIKTAPLLLLCSFKVSLALDQSLAQLLSVLA